MPAFQGSPDPEAQFPWLRMKKICFESLPLKSHLCQGQNYPSCWLSHSCRREGRCACGRLGRLRQVFCRAPSRHWGAMVGA